MNKVRRGDFPADLPVSGMPASLSGSRGQITSIKDDGLEAQVQAEFKPRRDLVGTDACRNQPRRDLTAKDTLSKPETDE